MPAQTITQITEDTFENVLQVFNDTPIIDLREVFFIDPYGMVGILEIGELLKSGNIQKNLYLPRSEEVLKYLERMDFFKFADNYFAIEPSKPQISDKYLRSSYSDVLLEITPIEKSDDIHFIVGKVKERANAILKKHLHYDERAINCFIVALSEVCQNIIEHSEKKGEFRFMTVRGRVGASQFIEFIKRLIQGVDRMILLIVDGHPAHKAKSVAKFIETEEIKKKFRLFFLPPYSPELNPDERVCNDLKNNSIGKQAISTPDKMRGAVISHLRFLQKMPARIRSYFNNATTKYAA